MSPFSSASLLTPDEYVRDLTHAIDASHTMIAVLVTTLRADDPRSQAIISALCRAADRHVSVSVYADTYTYLEPKESWLRSPKSHPTRAIQSLKLEHHLKHHGISFYWIGRKTSMIAIGRTHSKWTVIDDTVYTFGGLNMDDESFNNIDYMFRINSQPLASMLCHEFRQIRHVDKSGGAIKSHATEFDQYNTILFDGGLIGDSIIYRHACALAYRAAHIILVSQYCPTGPLSHILKRKRATLYYNHWSHASSVNRFMIRAGMLTSKSLTAYHHNAYLHAKFILFTMPNGHRVALTGSHNFMFSSGIMGTREIALETTEPHIIAQLDTFLSHHVA